MPRTFHLIALLLCMSSHMITLSSPYQEEAFHLRKSAKDIKGNFSFIQLGFDHSLRKNRQTTITALFRICGRVGNKFFRVSNDKVYSGFETWLESWASINGSHRFDKRFIGKVVGLYTSYRLGLHGPGLVKENNACLHSVAGKLSFSDPREIRDKINIGMAAHLNSTNWYVYIEKKWKQFPLDNMAIGIGIKGNEASAKPYSPEIFLKIPLPYLWDCIELPIVKIGLKHWQPFIRFGTE